MLIKPGLTSDTYLWNLNFRKEMSKLLIHLILCAASARKNAFQLCAWAIQLPVWGLKFGLTVHLLYTFLSWITLITYLMYQVASVTIFSMSLSLALQVCLCLLKRIITHINCRVGLYFCFLAS